MQDRSSPLKGEQGVVCEGWIGHRDIKKITYSNGGYELEKGPSGLT